MNEISRFVVVRLPPRPELDLDSACDSPRHDVEEAALAAKNLRLSRHLGFQEKGAVFNFRGDRNGFWGQGASGEGRGRSSLRLRNGAGSGTGADLRRSRDCRHLAVKS